MTTQKHNQSSTTKDEKQKTTNVGRSITEKDNTQQSHKPEKTPSKVHDHTREDNRDLDEKVEPGQDNHRGDDGIKRAPRNTIPDDVRGRDGNQIDKDEQNQRQNRGNR